VEISVSGYLPVAIFAALIVGFGVVSLAVARVLRPSRPDALAVFLFPWALVVRAVGLPAFWVMAAFVAIMGLGWLYAYREGVLEWK
jgi:NADH:ubiquinone oxidoreductase subunit 3 (subunit A)